MLIIGVLIGLVAMFIPAMLRKAEQTAMSNEIKAMVAQLAALRAVAHDYPPSSGNGLSYAKKLLPRVSEDDIKMIFRVRNEVQWDENDPNGIELITPETALAVWLVPDIDHSITTEIAALDFDPTRDDEDMLYPPGVGVNGDPYRYLRPDDYQDRGGYKHVPKGGGPGDEIFFGQSSCQIISPGLDGDYGDVNGNVIPIVTGEDATPSYRDGVAPAADNMANFTFGKTFYSMVQD